MNHPENNHAEEDICRDAETVSTIFTPAYRSLLQEPTVSLARNPNDRPDVVSVAILGYN